ncbi:MAG: hypothetical protein R6W76_16145 [Caldilinea sp.]
MAEIGLTYAPDDEVHRSRGVEFAFTKRVDRLIVGGLIVNDFIIEVGAMDYGFAIDGILGMDFLMSVGAIIDLGVMEIHVSEYGAGASCIGSAGCGRRRCEGGPRGGAVLDG